ncbi:MAG: dihydrodipicolinate synthase family protein [Christensenellales bacterium]
MQKKYCGVIPPIITPVDRYEKVDETGFRRLLAHCIANGIQGIFVAGTNGETMALTQAERDRAISIAVSECQGKIPVMCGVMDTGTQRVIENIKRLEQTGGEAAVVTPAFYAKNVSQDEILRHFEHISLQSNIDLFIYNIPSYCGSTITADTVMEIAKMDHITGYKDSSGNLADFIRCVNHFANTDFVVLQGVSNLAALAILAGGDGYVPSLAPLFPELYGGVYRYAAAGDVKNAMLYHAILMEAQKILGMSKNPLSANKFALSLLGFTSPQVLEPSMPVTWQEGEAIRKKAEKVFELAAMPNRIKY